VIGVMKVIAASQTQAGSASPGKSYWIH